MTSRIDSWASHAAGTAPAIVGPAAAVPRERVWWHAALLLTGALLALRIAASSQATFELDFEEAQYWAWLRELAFGYFSKPPLIAWIIRLAETTCGSSEFCIRAPAVILYVGAGLLVFAAGARLYDAATAFRACALVSLAPGIVFSARLVTTDAPMLFCIALTLFALTRLREDERSTGAAVLIVTAYAFLFRAYANWAAAVALPAILLAAAIMRAWRPAFVDGGLAIGLAVQVGLAIGDAVPGRIRLSFLAERQQPYAQFVGWRRLRGEVESARRTSGAAVVATDTRAIAAGLTFYGRADGMAVHARRQSARPGNYYEMTRPLTAGTAPPVLFVPACPDARRLAAGYERVAALGEVRAPVSQGRAYLFRLEGAREPWPGLPACLSCRRFADAGVVRLAVTPEHDPAKWAPLCRKRSCGTKRTRAGSIQSESIPRHCRILCGCGFATAGYGGAMVLLWQLLEQASACDGRERPDA